MPGSQVPNATTDSIILTDTEMNWTEEQVNAREGLTEGNYHVESH